MSVDYFVAIRLNRVETVRSILCVDLSCLNLVGKDGFTGLQLAGKYGYADVVQSLLDAGADAGLVDQKYGRTCLHWASMCGHTHVVLRLAISLNSFPSLLDVPDRTHCTALMLACKGGRAEIARMLLSSGASTAIPAGNVLVKSIVEVCNGSSELVALVTKVEPSSIDTAASAPTGGDNNSFWCFSTSDIGFASKAGGKHTQVVPGWMRTTPSNTTVITAGHSAPITEIMVKLSTHIHELEQELSTRRRCEHSPLHAHLAPAVHPTVVPVPGQPDWSAILLAKGVIDLHHLCDAMHQGSTHSRLRDAEWKVSMAQRLIHFSRLLSSEDLVWYDLKPSNFIVFPAAAVLASTPAVSCEDGLMKETVVKGGDSVSCRSELNGQAAYRGETVDCHVRGSAPHRWLQQSTWDLEEFALLATDLSSVRPAGTVIPSAADLSCTARFMHPKVARWLQGSGEGKGELVAEAAHMQWSVGMCILQLLHPEFKTFYAAHLGLVHSVEVHAFLAQADEVIQSAVDTYLAAEVVPWLAAHPRGKDVCSVLRQVLQI